MPGTEPQASARPTAPVRALLQQATGLLEGADSAAAAGLRAAAHRLDDPDWTILVAGLRSVGKSTLVGAMWGDAEMLPTAVRDCTQTNTLIRVPAGGEADRRIRLSYLPRDEATLFASRGLATERLAELVHEALGPMGPRLEELTPEERIRASVGAVRKLFADRPALLILHEHLTDALDELDEFLAFLDAPDYRSGETVEARWEDRREHLMGKRRADFRKVDVGRLLALRHVEIIRESDLWRGRPPRLIDTPWIPTFHNARRADLILQQARHADALLILALPEPFELEDWTRQLLRERPDLAGRTVVAFNQVDTVDRSTLFGRGGFGGAFQDCAESLVRQGLDADNLLVCCARLPFLEDLPSSEAVVSRIERLRTVLARLRELAEPRRDSAFRDRLLAACDPADAGLASLRARLEQIGEHAVRRQRSSDALEALIAIEEDDVPEDRRGEWADLAARAVQLRGELQ